MYYQCLGVTFCGRHMYDCILKNVMVKLASITDIHLVALETT